MRNKLVLVVLCSIFSIVAKAVSISGVVLDNLREPIIGASVLEKGTSNGTITDLEGKFVLNVQNVEEATLVVSYIGYVTQEVKLRGKRSFIVALEEDSKVIDEVVVVGYATQKKATLTGAVASVTGDELLKRSVVSTSTMLQGTMPGITVQQTSGEPGADGSSIRVRGTGSINAGQDPLVLVDGIEMALDRVDPNTIESISILKDASSASIYGSRAANGVVIITTKRGKEGNVSVSYKGTLTSQSPTNMPDRLSIADNMRYTNQAAVNASAGSLPYSQETIDFYSAHRADNWSRHETDWADEVIKSNALLTDHTVNVAGGSEKVRFVATANYTFQDGLVRTNDYERYSLRLNTDAELNKWTRLSLDAYMVQGTRLQPIQSARSLISKSLYLLGELPGINADGTWGEGKNGDNPIAVSREGGEHVTKTPELMLNGQLFITPMKGMEIQAQYSRRIVTTNVNNFTRGYDYYSEGNFSGHFYNPVLLKRNAQTLRNFYKIQGSYEKLFAKKHFVKLLAGFQAEDSTNESWESSKGGFEIPGYEYFSNATGDPLTSGSMNDWALASFFGRLNYNYDEKYLLEVSARSDASSRFAKHLRWATFPSVSLGWVFTKEAFASSFNEVLTMGKLRASYGILGNQNLSDNYPAYSRVNTGYSYWHNSSLSPGVAITTMSNPDITWEKSTQFNVGLDLSFWGGKLNVVGDFYIKDITDMIMKFPAPYYIGLQPAFTNAASMQNIGWDLAISYKGKIGSQFNYSASLILDDTRNKIKDLKGQTYQDLSYVVGYPAGGHWGYVTDGYYQNEEEVANHPYFDLEKPKVGFTKYVDQDGDGVITQEDRVYLGDPFPHYNFGVKLFGEYKGFDLNLFIQGVGEQAKYMSGIGVAPFLNGAGMFAHQTDTWSEDNRNAAYPILLPINNVQHNYDKSDRLVRSGAYARLKNVELGYRLPSAFMKKMKMNSVRVFASAQNLFTLSDYVKGFDPEASVTGTYGGEFYPIMQTFTFGLDIKF